MRNREDVEPIWKDVTWGFIPRLILMLILAALGALVKPLRR